MYLIVNISKKNICISDINISLQPKQAIDLDKVVAKEKSRGSANLKQCISSHFIKVLQQDKEKVQIVEKIKQIENKAENKMNDEQLRSLKEEIKKEISSNLSKVVSSDSGSKEVLDKINDLMLLMTQGVQSKDLAIKDILKDTGLDYNVLSEIHAKAVKNLTKTAEANVKYSEEKVENSAESRASELEDLIK